MTADPATPRERAVAIARRWIGTPYHHQASLEGVGTDCLGLLRGVLGELKPDLVLAFPAYTRDWAEALGRETFLEGARTHLAERPADRAEPGDVLIFRWRRGLPAKHAAILATRSTMIHAVEGAPVSEVPFSPWWRRRLAGVFALN